MAHRTHKDPCSQFPKPGGSLEASGSEESPRELFLILNGSSSRHTGWLREGGVGDLHGAWCHAA